MKPLDSLELRNTFKSPSLTKTLKIINRIQTLSFWRFKKLAWNRSNVFMLGT